MTTTNGPRMLRGDEATVYEQHHQELERIVARAVRTSEATIQDACSFAWLQFLRRQPDRDRAIAWLSTVAIRHAWHLDARERRTLPADALGNPENLKEAAPLEASLRARGALHALADLPHPQRQCLSLVVSGHSYNEIAAATGRTRTNVNKQLTRARRNLYLTA